MPRNTLTLQRFLKRLFRFFFRACASIRITGLENLPDGPPYILFSNHLSWFDPVLVVSFLPLPIHTMAMEMLFKFIPVGLIIRLVGGFPVRRETLDRKAIEEAIDILSHGGVILIFPEGGIMRLRNGEALRQGISLIAQRTNAPMVPIGISGCRDLYNPLKLLTRRAKIHIRIGRPFLISSLSKSQGKKMRIAAMERVKKEMCVLAGEELLLSERS